MSECRYCRQPSPTPVCYNCLRLATIEAWAERVQNGQMSLEDFTQKIIALNNDA